MRPIRLFVMLAALLACADAGRFSPVHADPQTLPDSTIVDRWDLANGLRVVTRHIPHAAAVVVTVCYRVGSDHDPPKREGWARLLAEVVFTGPAGDTPARTRAEMESLRPKGWNLKVTPTYTQLSEIATLEQFPGVLLQVANRMRGVTVTPAALRSAIATVTGDLAESYAANVDYTLYFQVRKRAAGTDHETVERYASGAGLQGLSENEVRSQIEALYVPANAVLSLAGNLRGFAVRRMVEGEFANIPAGNRMEDRPAERLRPGSFESPVKGLQAPAGVVGVVAPALDDPLHPSFYLHTLLFGSFVKTRWGTPEPPLTTRFEYPLLEDPDLVRLYPAPGLGGAPGLAEELRYTLFEMGTRKIGSKAYDQIRRAVRWLLGGPLPRAMALRMRTDMGALYTLSSGMAARELWGGEAFWSKYRQSFDAVPTGGFEQWISYFVSREHQVQLLLTPDR